MSELEQLHLFSDGPIDEQRRAVAMAGGPVRYMLGQLQRYMFDCGYHAAAYGAAFRAGNEAEAERCHAAYLLAERQAAEARERLLKAVEHS